MDISSTRIEIKTEYVITSPDIVHFLDENSDGIINRVGSHITAWSFEKGQGLEVLNKFIEKNKSDPIGYMFISNKDNSIIAAFE